MLRSKILLFEGLINKTQFDLIINIDDILEKMSNNIELLSDNALKINEEWNECRKKGLELLLNLENSNSIERLLDEIEVENWLEF